MAIGAPASFACSLSTCEKLSFRALLGSPFKLSIAFTCRKASILGAFLIGTLVRGGHGATFNCKWTYGSLLAPISEGVSTWRVDF